MPYTLPAGTRLVGRAVVVRANRSAVPLSLDPRAVRAVREAVADAEVVHVHEPLVPLVSWAALATKRPLVATFHAAPPRWVKVGYSLAAAPLRRILGRATVVTAVSEVAATAVRHLVSAVGVIPLGIDVAAYRLEIPRHPRRVVFVGRDDPRKGLEVLLAAWPAVRRGVPDAELVVVGATRANRLEGVRFLGRLSEDEKRRQLAEATVYCAPNLGGESFGLAVAEAMAAGCAVVASDLPAFRAVAGEAARLVPAGDPESLASALIALLGEPGVCGSMASLGRARVGAFDWSAVVPGYRAAYRRALGGQ